MSLMADYHITVWNDKYDNDYFDEVDGHIPEINNMMKELGITEEFEDMENCFSGYFNPNMPSIDDIIIYLEGLGWKRDKSKFTFNVDNDNEEEGKYNIFVWHPKYDDNIGSHIPEVDDVMKELGITGEDMENCFSGLFNSTIKNCKDVVSHFKSAGWEIDKTLEV